jgi:hypothetical protein
LCLGIVSWCVWKSVLELSGRYNESVDEGMWRCTNRAYVPRLVRLMDQAIFKAYP